MPAFPAITVRQPLPFDLVDDPVEICGVGTGFEGSISSGETGIWGNYHATLPLLGVPATLQGTIDA